MAGAAARTEQLDSIADNLANSQTVGFKSSHPAFEAFLTRSGSQEEVFPAAMATSFDRRNGNTIHTGNQLDVTPEDGAYLAVRNGDGISFTRNGNLTVDSNGLLRAGRYLALQADGSPISLPPNTVPEVTSDGGVRKGEQLFGYLGRFQLVGKVDRQGPELMIPGDGGAAIRADVRVRTGELEASNANVLEATVGMVTAQRNYDSSMQALQTYKTMDDKANDIGRIR